jgi:hypothetical protein
VVKRENKEKASSRRSLRLTLALSLFSVIATHAGPAINTAEAALYTTNLAFQLDPSNATSWPNSADTWYDLSGLNHNFVRPASGAGRPTFQSGSPSSFLFTRAANSGAPPSNAGYFTGTNSWIGGNDFTVSAWIKTTGVGGSGNHWELMQILSAESGSSAWDWGFGIDNSGRLAFGTGYTDYTFYSPSAVNTGSWTYVAATRQKSNGVIRLYVNGSLVTTSTSTSNTSALQSNTNIRLGAGDDGGYSFGGNIGAVFAYSALLTDSQITQNFDATKGSYGFATATTTSLSALNSTTQYGAIDTLTATVSDATATGTMNFRNNGTSVTGCSARTVTSGVATCPFSPPATGTFSNLTAVYSGDSNFATSTSGAITINVNQGQTELVLSVATTIPYRTSASITAVSTPAGTDGIVSFTANGKKIAGCTKLPSTLLTTTCNWMPSIHTQVTLRASLTPTNAYYSSVSALPKLVFVKARTNNR